MDCRAPAAGVFPALGCARRTGDSGLGREGRDRGRNVPGEGARTLLIALTDWLNLLCAIDGGVISSCSFMEECWSSEGVVGVRGMDEPWDVVGDVILTARPKGKKIPEPGMEVVK